MIDGLDRATARWEPVLLDADVGHALSPEWARLRLARSGSLRVVPYNAGLDPEVRDGEPLELRAGGAPAPGDVVLARVASRLRLLRVVSAAGAGLACKTDVERASLTLGSDDVLARRRAPLAPAFAVSSRAVPWAHRVVRDLRRHAARHLGSAAAAESSVLARYSDPANVATYGRKVAAGLDAREERLVATYLPGRGRVLVAGGAAGRVPLALARRGHAVVALDVSQPMLEATRRACAGHDVACVAGSIERPPVRGPFDAIVLGLYVHSNVPGRARRVAMVREWAGLLAPGAHVILSVRRYEGVRDWIAKNALLPFAGGALREWGDWSGLDVGHDLRPIRFYYHYFTRRELRRELERGGLRCVEQDGEWAVGGRR